MIAILTSETTAPLLFFVRACAGMGSLFQLPTTTTRPGLNPFSSTILEASPASSQSAAQIGSKHFSIPAGFPFLRSHRQSLWTAGALTLCAIFRIPRTSPTRLAAVFGHIRATSARAWKKDALTFTTSVRSRGTQSVPVVSHRRAIHSRST